MAVTRQGHHREKLAVKYEEQSRKWTKRKHRALTELDKVRQDFCYEQGLTARDLKRLLKKFPVEERQELLDISLYIAAKNGYFDRVLFFSGQYPSLSANFNARHGSTVRSLLSKKKSTQHSLEYADKFIAEKFHGTDPGAEKSTEIFLTPFEIAVAAGNSKIAEYIRFLIAYRNEMEKVSSILLVFLEKCNHLFSNRDLEIDANLIYSINYFIELVNEYLRKLNAYNPTIQENIDGKSEIKNKIDLICTEANPVNISSATAILENEIDGRIESSDKQHKKESITRWFTKHGGLYREIGHVEKAVRARVKPIREKTVVGNMSLNEEAATQRKSITRRGY